MTREEYYKQHQICPKCLEVIPGITTGMLWIKSGTVDTDKNSAKCLSCGWVGIVHDLIEDKNDISQNIAYKAKYDL